VNWTRDDCGPDQNVVVRPPLQLLCVLHETVSLHRSTTGEEMLLFVFAVVASFDALELWRFSVM
jgi:hypothetical protein